MHPSLAELKHRLAEIYDLSATQALMNWDQQTMMPRRAAPARAEQLATLAKLLAERQTDPVLGRLLDDLQAYADSLPYDHDDACLIRVARRDFEKAVKVPPALIAEMQRAGVLGVEAWSKARAESDFSQFQPFLQKSLDLNFQYIEHLRAGFPSAYDVLLDDYEPGINAAEVTARFAELKQALIPLIAQLSAHPDAVSDACLRSRFSRAKQEDFCRTLVHALGARWDSWRLDRSLHPFSSGTAIQDIRITNRYSLNYLGEALYGALHEFGHGLYEHQICRDLERTPLGHGASLGVHESQSRTWENLVGRSRAFCRFLLPQLQNAFPNQLGSVDEETFYRAVNKVQPSYIRVQADEVTYSLHIILRFELEQAMIDGSVQLKDLPEEWNRRFKEYFGLDVPDDAQGVLQDIHWADGTIGYFPTYALGNVVASQLWAKVRVDLPDLDDQLAAGDFAPLREWQERHIHYEGRKFTLPELLQRAIGEELDVQPYVRYLRSKYEGIYGIVPALA